MAPFILNIGARRRLVVNPDRFIPGKQPRYELKEEKYLLLLLGFEPQTISTKLLYEFLYIYICYILYYILYLFIFILYYIIYYYINDNIIILINVN